MLKLFFTLSIAALAVIGRSLFEPIALVLQHFIAAPAVRPHAIFLPPTPRSIAETRRMGLA